jgi:hypothetical protein
MDKLCSSSLTCLVDDSKMTESLGEFLLQVQGGLSQGSSQTGLKIPKGGILLTTNNPPETDRYKFFFSKIITYESDCQAQL